MQVSQGRQRANRTDKQRVECEIRQTDQNDCQEKSGQVFPFKHDYVTIQRKVRGIKDKTEPIEGGTVRKRVYKPAEVFEEQRVTQKQKAGVCEASQDA